MSNIYDFGVNGLFPSKVGGTGTAKKYFPRLLGITGTTIGASGLGGVSGSSVAAPLFGSAPATPSASNAVGALFLPAQNTNNGQQMDFLVTGNLKSKLAARCCTWFCCQRAIRYFGRDQCRILV